MNKMPKKVINDYTFYKIVCLDNSVDLCYVGSTADFNKRRNVHKSDCNNENSKTYNYKIYKTIRENGGWCNFKMVQLGTREQLTKREAEQIEEEYRQELKANMNSVRCFRTEEQKQEQIKECYKKYREENKEKLLEKNKEYLQKYREENKEKLKELNQNWREANRDKVKEQEQKYREANRDKIKEQKQKYREANKDRINEKIKCECGCVVIKRTLLRHKKTPKHIKLMEMKTNENKNI